MFKDPIVAQSDRNISISRILEESVYFKTKATVRLRFSKFPLKIVDCRMVMTHSFYISCFIIVVEMFLIILCRYMIIYFLTNNAI